MHHDQLPDRRPRRGSHTESIRWIATNHPLIAIKSIDGPKWLRTKEQIHVGPERTPENLPFALAPVAYVSIVIAFAVLQRMEWLAPWAELLDPLRSTATPAASFGVSRDDEAIRQRCIHHGFTKRTIGHVRRPLLS